MFVNSLLKKKNRELFDIKSYGKKTILIEYNNFYGSHLCQALLANFLKKKQKSKIVAYFNYCLITSPLKLNFFQKIKWSLSNYFLTGFKGIYNSFGVEKIIRPSISKEISLKALKITNNFFKKKLSNQDIVNFKVDKIWIGDLIYDTYLKSNLIPSFEPNEDSFKNYFIEFLELFFFWQKYFKTHSISHTIGVHSCYSFGIPLRISMNLKIPTYVVNTRAVMKLNEKSGSMYGGFKYYKEKFSKLKKNFKKKAIKISRENIKLRIGGTSGVDVGLYNREKSSFSKVKNLRTILRNNKKIKILICTHDFLDSIHVNGKNFFPDFYLWISYLGKLSIEKKNVYDFYIKSHPNLGNKYEKYQRYTDKFVDELVNKFPKIKKIPNDTSHLQIISEGIDYVLTVYGSVGIEYAFFGIPVINASRNNPHISYNFNINPKNKKDYIKILNNLRNKKIKINKNDVLACYFMKHFFWDENWLFDNYKKFMNEIGGYHNIHSKNLYKYWLKNIDKKFINKIYERFENFDSSDEFRLSIFNSSKEKILSEQIRC